MSAIKRDIKKKLDELTDNEKLLVLNYLVQELDRPNPEIDKAWAKEASRRQKDMKAGKVKTLSHEEVFGKYKK
jgi:putative addiction module component (TIGR02574 family)